MSEPNDKNLNPKVKYSDTTGSKASKAEAIANYKKAREGLLKHAAEKMDVVIAAISEGKMMEAQREKEVTEKLTTLKEDLITLNEKWVNYTSHYVSRSLNDYSKSLKSMSDEVEDYKKFYKELNNCYEQFKELQQQGMNNFKEFSDAFSVIHNVKGHYDEMTNGALQVPKDAKYHIKAKDPKIDKYEKKSLRKQLGPKYVKEERRYANRKATPLFVHEPSPDDIFQGSLGDCWLVSTLSAICVNNPQMIRDMIKDNNDGTVTVRFFSEDKGSYVPYYVTVDKSVGYAQFTDAQGASAHTTFGNRESLWVQMIEKAYAASGIHKGRFNESNKDMQIENVNGGFMSKAMNALFGGVNVDNKDIQDMKSDDEFFQTIKDAVDEKRVITAATGYFRSHSDITEKYKQKVKEFKIKNKKSPTENERKELASEASYGLVVKTVSDKLFRGVRFANHAYSVTDAFEKDGEKYVTVRNPHGRNSYNVMGKDAEDTTLGYSTIPLKKFREIFDITTISTPIAVAGYKNPAEEIANLTRGMMETFGKSRSVTSYLTFRRSMSNDFREMYDAMKLVDDIANSKAPSKLALTRALDQLSVKAEKYLSERVGEENATNDRNLRVTIAKAALSLAVAYKNNEGEALAGRVKDITQNILRDRVNYVNRFDQSDAAGKAGLSKDALEKIKGLDDKQLYKSIEKINEYAKANAKEKAAKEKAVKEKTAKEKTAKEKTTKKQDAKSKDAPKNSEKSANKVDLLS